MNGAEMQYLALGLSIGFAIGYTVHVIWDLFFERR